MDEKVLEKSTKNVLDLYYLNEHVINDTNIADKNDGKYVDIDLYGNFKRLNKRKRDVQEAFRRDPKKTMADRRFSGMESSVIRANAAHVHSNMCIDLQKTNKSTNIRITHPWEMMQMRF